MRKCNPYCSWAESVAVSYAAAVEDIPPSAVVKCFTMLWLQLLSIMWVSAWTICLCFSLYIYSIA